MEKIPADVNVTMTGRQPIDDPTLGIPLAALQQGSASPPPPGNGRRFRQPRISKRGDTQYTHFLSGNCRPDSRLDRLAVSLPPL